MSDFSLTLVLRLKTSKIINDMAMVSIKSQKITPFGGIFHVRDLFSRHVGSTGLNSLFVKIQVSTDQLVAVYQQPCIQKRFCNYGWMNILHRGSTNSIKPL